MSGVTANQIYPADTPYGVSAHPAFRSFESPDSGWAVEDLTRRVERALDTATAAIRLVDADGGGVDLAAVEAPPQKIVAETALLLRIAAGVPAALAPGVSERAHELMRELLPHARHPRIRAAISMHPALARDYAFPHVMLAKAGYSDAELDFALAVALAAPTCCARERLPHRELEQAWIDSLLGAVEPDGELVARTALVRGVDLISGSRDDVYAFTHAVMYATDFGLRKSRLPGSAADPRAMAEGAIAGALDDDDFDLAGELLLTWPCLGVDWSPVASLAFAVLARVEDEVGILPSFTIDAAEYRRQPAAARPHYVAAVTYHTAYVMGILCALILRLGKRPLAALPVTPSSTRAEELIGRLATGSHQPQWHQDVKALPANRRASCISLLLDVAVRRAARRLDLDEVRSLLRAGVESGAVLSPVSAQGAGILRRFARCSEFSVPAP